MDSVPPGFSCPLSQCILLGGRDLYRRSRPASQARAAQAGRRRKGAHGLAATSAQHVGLGRFPLTESGPPCAYTCPPLFDTVRLGRVSPASHGRTIGPGGDARMLRAGTLLTGGCCSGFWPPLSLLLGLLAGCLLRGGLLCDSGLGLLSFRSFQRPVPFGRFADRFSAGRAQLSPFWLCRCWR